MKKLLIISATTVAVTGMIVIATLAYRDFTSEEYAEGVPEVSWLPETASNISFYRSYRNTAEEFNMGEEDFLALAQAREWRLNEVKRGESPPIPPAIVPRYKAFHLRPPNYETDQDAFERWHENNAVKRITQGYFYQDIRSSGGGITVGYDMELHRAYIYSCPR